MQTTRRSLQKWSLRFCVVGFAVLVTAACLGTSSKIPGETQAEPSLHAAIVHAIGMHEAAAPGGRKKPEIVDTKILSADGKSRREIWTVLRRGEKIDYEVTLSPAAPPEEQISVRRIRPRRYDGD